MKLNALLTTLVLMAAAAEAAPAAELSPAVSSISDITVREAEGAVFGESDISPRVPDPWEKWHCAVYVGGPGHDRLRKVHATFNRIYGESRLKLKKHQGMFVKCHGVVFGIKNKMGVGTTEISNARNKARDSDPKKGQGGCIWENKNNALLYYLYGWEDDYTISPINSIVKRC